MPEPQLKASRESRMLLRASLALAEHRLCRQPLLHHQYSKMLQKCFKNQHNSKRGAMKYTLTHVQLINNTTRCTIYFCLLLLALQKLALPLTNRPHP